MTEDWTSREDFVKGLVDAGGTPDFEDYVYAGGGSGSKQDYFMKRYLGTRVDPGHANVCLCGHKIVENCYIQHKTTGKFYIIGNHCIKRFMYKLEKTCTFCGTVHKNRKDNVCNECRDRHVLIKVTYAQKEEAKALGARWNPSIKLWWVHPSNVRAIEEFGRFF